jgi:site-specific recombinase
MLSGVFLLLFVVASLFPKDLSLSVFINGLRDAIKHAYTFFLLTAYTFSVSSKLPAITGVDCVSIGV